MIEIDQTVPVLIRGAMAMGSGDEAPAVPSPIEVGCVVAGRYRVAESLGEGGMGRVWLAEDLEEQREVALKELRAGAGDGSHSPEHSALLFRREFFAMKRLEHPGTVKVFDCGMLETSHRYLTMEVVHGRDLDELVAGGRLEPTQIDEILTSLAEVLAFIHARQFVHCDIKASNVRVTGDGRVKVMDFGIMHPLGTRASDVVSGTPAYMAPEWQSGDPIDGRADLYSLGALGFLLATGQLPFRSRSAAHLLDAHLLTPPPLPSSIAPIDPKLEAILLRLLAKKPRDRFAGATELLSALAEARGRSPPEALLSAGASYLRVPDAVGRHEEVACLRRRLDDAEQSRSRAIWVTAPAGVGKSHLLRELELIVRNRDVPFATGQCRPEGLAPLAPLAQALRALVPLTPPEILERYRPRLAGLLLPAAGAALADGTSPLQPAPDASAMRDALGKWLRGLSARRSFVIALEDLHWADDTTLHFLGVILRALNGTRGLVVGAFRSDEVEPAGALREAVEDGLADELELRPLSREHVGALVSSVLDGLDVPEAFVDHLHAATGGNPFFVTECLRMLIEQGALRLSGGRWEPGEDLSTRVLPGSIRETVFARLATLSPSQLEFFRSLAPLGRALDLPLVRELSPAQGAARFEALEDGVERQFLTYAQGRYFFTHDALREAIYDGTPATVRAEYHGSIARAIERRDAGRTDSAPAIGYHFALSTEPWRAIAPLLLAGRQARAGSALLDATLLLAQAADLLEKHPEYPDGEALLTSTWAALIELGYTGDPPTCIRYADKLLGHWAATPGVLDEGRAATFAALEAAWGTEPPELRAAMLSALYREITVDGPLGPRDTFLKTEEVRMFQCIALAIMGQTAKVVALHDRIAAEQSPWSPYRAASFAALAVLAAHTGRSSGVLAASRDSVGLLLRIRDAMPDLPRALAWGVGIATFMFNSLLTLRGEPADQAVRAAGVAIAERHSLADIRLFHAFADLFRASFSGDGATFPARLDEVVQRARGLGNPRLPERNIAVFTPPYYLERLEVEQASLRIEKGARLAKLLASDRWLGLHVLAYRACVDAIAGGGDTSSMRHAKAAAREAGFRHLTMLLAYESRAAVARGDRRLARSSAEEALARATGPELSNPFDEILARRALAGATEGAGALAHLTRAASLAIETGHVLQDGIAHLELAEACAKSDPGAARAHLARAEERFAAAHAARWTERAAALRQAAFSQG